MNLTIKAVVTNRDGNIEGAAVITSSPGMLAIQVSTKQKRPSICAWTSTGFILQPADGGDGLGDQIEFSGLPFEPRLCFGETGRYGVYVALVEIAEDSEPVVIEIDRRFDAPATEGATHTNELEKSDA